MTDRIFVDSNIWVYLFIEDEDIRSKVAKEYITKSAANSILVISYQVVNEVCHVLKRKKFIEPEIRGVAYDMMGLCEVCGYSSEIIYLASELREKHSFSYWDSHVVASALKSQCDVLVSEDMQDGLKIGSMLINNVFSASR